MFLALKIRYEGQNRRLRIPSKEGDFTIEDVNQAVTSIFKSFEGRTFSLSYLDDEGDETLIASTIELQEALACAGTKQANGDWQLKLNVKINGEPACLQSMTPSEEVKKDKEEEEEEEEKFDHTSPTINSVPLTDLFDQHVITNPFFVQMREDFVKFAQNVHDSVPRDFPEKTRAQMEPLFENLRQPIANFAAEVQKNYKEIRVPEEWKQNPLIVQLSDSLKNCREEMSSRMGRWNQTQDQLVQMGFEDAPFIQRVLIIIHDGDLRKVLDDLLVRQGQAERVDTTFQNLGTAIACLFRNLDAHGAAFFQRSSDSLQVLGGHIRAGASSSAQYIQIQIDANQEIFRFLQNELDHNVRALQTTLDRLNDNGSENLQNGLAHGANFFAHILKNIQKIQKELEDNREVRSQAREEAAMGDPSKEEAAKEEAKEEAPAEIMMDEIPKEEAKEEVKEDIPKDPRLDESLKLLQEMGFVDLEKCAEILIASNYDMEAVLDQM